MPYWVDAHQVDDGTREDIMAGIDAAYDTFWDDVGIPDPFEKTETVIGYSEEDYGAFLACLDPDVAPTVRGYDLTLEQTPDRLREMHYPPEIREPLTTYMIDHDVAQVYHTVLHPDDRYRGVGQDAVAWRQAMLEESWPDDGVDLIVSIVRRYEDGERTPVHHIAEKYGFADTGMTFTGGSTEWSLMQKARPGAGTPDWE